MADRELSLWHDSFHGAQAHKATPNPDGYKIVSVRLREAEFLSFAEQANALGLTNNMALRIAARRIAGFLEIDSESRLSLQEISRSIGEMAGSLAHLRQVAQRSNVVDLEALNSQRAAFGKEFMALEFLLRQLLSTSKRRRDGRAMLIEASRN
ncbi:hypothetical protein N183_34975 [Sinorhizobium sp. Sb3]|uniref:DNA mobilization endonuclease VirD1/MobC family subunit n=1 Tax=Sinorhizobium sp. Sb3 TaxID=1358417 RepID=UPI00071DEEBB|nr:DNA mobilization endonuclease VirD1/MobC family subunit [Sinorhizobium sp. Sb3]KSV64571.1 hypothetical protein N183_34975 [Sinorhizobium sp. Sb3]